MSKSINKNTNITSNDALIISKIEELMKKNAGVQPSETKYPRHDQYVDANGETVHVWKSREYRLSDLKNKAIPEFDVDEVARYMLIDWASILHDLRIADLDDIKYALDNAHISPDDAVMIGDRSHDIEGAKANGLPSVGVLYGYGDRAEHESAGADFIAESVSELRGLLLG